MFHIHILALMLSVAMSAEVELTIGDISTRHVKVGRLLPRNPHAVIGQIFHSSCVLDRRKLLRSLNITIDDVFFRFSLINKEQPLDIPRRYMTKVNQSTVELRYPNITIDFHRGDISCLARINKTSVLLIHDHILYAGYSPGVGHIVDVITEDLVAVKVVIAKSHSNPSYPTHFSLLCRFRENENFLDCPNQTTLTNDTIEFLTRLKEGERFGDNRQPIAVRVKSSSLLGGTAVGGTTTFSLYEKFKPRSVSDLTVQYSGGQTAVVEWMYPEPVPLGLEYTLIVKSKWDDHAKVYMVSGGYLQNGPFRVTLTDLHWATTYNVSIGVKPIVNGHPSDRAKNISFVTVESIPAANPSVISSGYERTVRGQKQDVVIYWQPVPEQLLNGIVNQTILQVLINHNIQYITVNKSEALLHQAHVSDLFMDKEYLFVVMIGTSKGVCHHITSTINVPSLHKALPPLENFTAIIHRNEEGRRGVHLSWKPYKLEHCHLFVHWCVGRHGYPCQGMLHTFTVNEDESSYDFDDLPEPYMQYKFGTSIESNSSNSGLHWANCTYDITKVPQKPLELRSVEVSQYQGHIYIVPGLCTLAQGYAYQLIVIIHNGNKEVLTTKIFQVNLSGTYTITSLKPGQQYILSVYADSVRGRSDRALIINLKTDPLSIKIHIIVIAGCVFVIFVLAIALIICRCYKRCKKELPVLIPQTQDEEQAETRQLPDGGYGIIISRESHEEASDKVVNLSDEDCDKQEMKILPDREFIDCTSSDGDGQEQDEQSLSACRNSPEGTTSSLASGNSMSVVLQNDQDSVGSNIDPYLQCHVQDSVPGSRHSYIRGEPDYASDEFHNISSADRDVVGRETDNGDACQVLLRSNVADEDTDDDEDETSPKSVLKFSSGYI